MKYISTDKAPTPAGHYSQAVEHNGTIYVAGQLPIDPTTGEQNHGSISEQTELVLNNLKNILDEAGSSMQKVLKVNIYIADIKLWGGVNKVYGKAFGDHKPARCVAPVPELHFGFLVEVEAVAYV